MNDKPYIAYFTPANDLYGSSRMLLNVVSCVQKAGRFNPLVCMPAGPGPLKDELHNRGIPVVEMPVMQLTRSMLRSIKLFGLLAAYFRGRQIFKEKTAHLNIVFIQSNTLATLFGAAICRFSKHRHIFHVHEIVEHPRLASRFFKGLLKGWSDHIIFNSIATSNYYTAGSAQVLQKSTTIVNCVPAPKRRSDRKELVAIRQKWFQDQQSLQIIGLIGRVNRLKGHQTLLRAFARLEERFPNARMVFVGSPPPGQDIYLKEVKSTIRELKLDEKVKIMDFHPDVFPLFEAMDIITVPSTEAESFGLVAVEAMLAQKPVVASNIGGLPFIIDHGKTGLLCQPSDVHSLANQLKRLLGDPRLREELGHNARIQAETVYSEERLCRDLIDFYDKLSRDE